MPDPAVAINAIPTVLIADDDADLLDLVARRLSKAGYNVITATDGEQALRMAEEHLPELAVLDVMMPKLSGHDVTKRLRAQPATRDMLVMLISGASGETDTSGRACGADDYVSKPFGPDEVARRVQAVLGR